MRGEVEREEGNGSVAAGSITETAGRAAERATKGDENFPAAAKVLSVSSCREKSRENRGNGWIIFEFSRGIFRTISRLIREIVFFYKYNDRTIR